MRRLFGCPDIVSLTEKFLMARNFFWIFAENNPVMWDSKTFCIPEAKGLTILSASIASHCTLRPSTLCEAMHTVERCMHPSAINWWNMYSACYLQPKQIKEWVFQSSYLKYLLPHSWQLLQPWPLPLRYSSLLLLEDQAAWKNTKKG